MRRRRQKRLALGLAAKHIGDGHPALARRRHRVRAAHIEHQQQVERAVQRLNGPVLERFVRSIGRVVVRSPCCP